MSFSHHLHDAVHPQAVPDDLSRDDVGADVLRDAPHGEPTRQAH